MLHFAHFSGNVHHNFRCIPFMCWEEMCLVNDNALVRNLCSSAPCYVPSSTASKCECAWVRKNKFLTKAVQLKAQNVDNSSSSLPKHIMANSSSIADRTSHILSHRLSQTLPHNRGDVAVFEARTVCLKSLSAYQIMWSECCARALWFYLRGLFLCL